MARWVVAIFPLLLLLLLNSSSCSAQNANFACDVKTNPNVSSFGFCNKSMGMEARVGDLIGRLNLIEKIEFLVSKSPAVPRLGLPAYEWWSEALHGISFVGPGTHFSSLVPGATSFPQVILTAASFNTTLFQAIGKVVSTEGRAMYNLGLAGLTYWSPNVNILRDPRWGRAQETPGEDPLLVSRYGVEYVKGLQQSLYPNTLKVAACCKHYTAYDVDNWNGVLRYTFDAKVTKQDMDDTYQVPFKSCIVDGDVASVMCSYNKVNGVPTCADPDLLAGVIRRQWKLHGYIVSDCDSVSVLYNAQHYTKTPEEAAAKSILAGLDLNCGAFLGQHTAGAIEAGLLEESDIDKAITNNIATLMRLGFYDGDPSSHPFGHLGASDVCSDEHRQLALDAARQGIVLLKNSNSTLPFSSSSISTLALIGPNANATKTMIGNYEGNPCSYVSPLQGLATMVSNVIFQEGCAKVTCTNATLKLDEAKEAAAKADATVLVIGTDQSIEKESHDRVSLTLPGEQETLVTEVAKVAKGPVVVVLMSGGPLDVSFAKNDDRISGILWAGFPGEKGGAAISDVIFGKHNPSGKLPMTWYPEEYVEKVSMTDMNMRANKAKGYPGRTYRFYEGEVVYPFGHGLSYTEFQHQTLGAPPPPLISIPLEEGHHCHQRNCSSIEIDKDTCHGLTFDAHLEVKNVGNVDGIETVFLFSSPPDVHRAPKKQLVGFERIGVKVAESKKVVFKVDVCKDLRIVDENGVNKLGLGLHSLHVGNFKHSLDLKV